MEHRRFLTHPEAHRPFAGGDTFARIGGTAAVTALIDGLCDRIEADAAVRPLFGRDLANEREAQKRFFTEWLGGERSYSERAFHTLKQRHDLLPITSALAGRWLAHFRDSLDSTVSDNRARQAIYGMVHRLATALVNEHEPPSALRARPHGTCLRYQPAIDALGLARRGDVAGLGALLERAPDVLASTPHAATLMHLAVLAGRTAVVELLLRGGVDVDKPSPIEPLIFVTPLCAARVKQRKAIETLLVRHGAKEDIFTHAYLGDLGRLREILVREPSLSQAVDPAADVLEITPIHHAVAGARVEALRELLVHTNGQLLGGARALRTAAERENVAMVVERDNVAMAVERDNVAMVAMLLEHGADATRIGAGRWVGHTRLAPMLARAGACVDRSGSWIGLSCTGNQARKDDPEYVAALLRHGARANDKRFTGQGTDRGHATALHYAAKAGFVKTIAILLEHGADPCARDNNGLTPLDWLRRSAKSVDRDAVRRVLCRPGVH
jgi:truncated hemoglobin YjbI